MRQFRLAVGTRCFAEPLLESIKTAAELNVKGVQFDLRYELRASEITSTGRRDLLHQISEYGLTVSGAVFPLNYPLFEQDKLDVRIAAIRDAMKFAYSLNSTVLCLRVGRIPEEAESKDRQLLVEVLSDLARHSTHIGTTLAITPTNDSAETLLKLVQEIKTGLIGIDFDPAHFAMTRRPVAESLRILHEHVVHVQLRDGDSGMRGGEERAVGRGNVDWIEVFALLSEMDYRGWLTAIRTEGDDRASDIRRGLGLIRQSLLGG
ncbi:sugar phosphate isomerase/epimerase family protein [Schlesneria sp. DSM 10557]|uniref:sugar phosphate isomerase/epimerase family protein n=1 Tax=Schlesneria sp. DSM 10557 TaxID=3044399 RepID=UPI0035A04F43